MSSYLTAPSRPVLVATSVANLRTIASDQFIGGFLVVLDTDPAQVFKWSTISVAADDGVNVIKPADVAGAGRWVLAFTFGDSGGLILPTRAALRAAVVPGKSGVIANVASPSGKWIPFVFDATSVVADDGFTTIKPDAIAGGDPGRWELNDAVLDIRYFDAVPNVAAGGDPIQVAIDTFDPQLHDHIWIPPLEWQLSRPLLIGKDSAFVACAIRGAVVIFEAGSAVLSRARIVFDDGSAASKSNFILGIQGARGVSVDGVMFCGPNHAFSRLYALYAPRPYTVFFDPAIKFADFVDAGIRVNAYSPNAIIAVDPFKVGYPNGLIGNCYPYFTDHYGVNPGDFTPVTSAVINLTNCACTDGNIALVVSPNKTSNGEGITVRNPQFDYCRTTYNLAQNQSRGVVIENARDTGWFFWIDTEQSGVGGNAGQTPKLLSNCEIGQGKWMFNTVQTSQPMQVNSLYCEAVYSLGRVGFGISSGVEGAIFTGCKFTFIDELDAAAVSAGYPAAPFHFSHCGVVTFQSCTLTTSSGSGLLRIHNRQNDARTLFYGCSFLNNDSNGTIQVTFDSEFLTEIPSVQLVDSSSPVNQEFPTASRIYTRRVKKGDNSLVVTELGGNPSTGRVLINDTSDVRAGDVVRILNGYSGHVWNPTQGPPADVVTGVFCGFGVVSAINANVSFDIARIGAEFPFGSTVALEIIRWDGAPTFIDAYDIDEGGGTDPDIGMVVYFNSGTGKVAAALASDPTKMPAIGYIDRRIAFGKVHVNRFGSTKILPNGVNAAGSWWVSRTTAGALQSTAPNTAGDRVQQVGFARTSTEYEACFDNEFSIA